MSSVTSGTSLEQTARVITLCLLAFLSIAASADSLTTATSAVLWEFAEYISDHSFGSQTQGGLEDTLLDMLLGILGGFTMVSFLLLAKHGYGKTRHK